MSARDGAHARRRGQFLLRLYPRAWRARYGDELLDLIDQTGWTWRVVTDVIAGATVERVRVLIELRGREADPLSIGRISNAMTFSDNVLDFIMLVTLVVATMGLGRVLGIPWPLVPSWTSWLPYVYLVSALQARYGTFGRPLAPRAERIGLAYYYFIEAAAFVLPIFLLGRALSAIGVPDPPDRLFLALLALGGVWVLRVLYCGLRIGLTPMTWNGLHGWEVRVWKLVAVSFCVVIAIVDPGWQLFWILAMVWVYLLRTPTALLPLGAARRRANLELTDQRLREKFLVQNFPANWR